MKKIVTYFVERYRVSILLSFAFVLTGIWAINSLVKETRPPVDFAQVIIVTAYPGASPEEVEQSITEKIERAVRPISNIKKIISFSRVGVSEINVFVNVDAPDSKDTVSDIERKVQTLRGLPEDSLEPLIRHIRAELIPILQLGISGPDKNIRENLAHSLDKQLSVISGVSSVDLGFKNQVFEVLLDLDKLTALNLNINEVAAALRLNPINFPVGYYRAKEPWTLVQISNKPNAIKDIENTYVKSNFSGKTIQIKDIAQVQLGTQYPISDLYRTNGENLSFISINKTKNADAIILKKNINKVLTRFQNNLPKGYAVKSFLNEIEFIKNNWETVSKNAIFGLFLVLFSFLIFLPGKIGWMGALSLPFTFFGVLGYMVAFGINFNIITMLAMIICVGMLVDNTSVITEYYAKLREQGRPAKEAAIESVVEFYGALLSTSLTTILAFLPMLVTTGVMGQFIRYIPILVTVSLLFSLFEAFYLLPTRLQFVDCKSKKMVKKKKIFTFYQNLEKQFKKIIILCLRFSKTTILLAFTVTLVSIFIGFKFNRFILFPQNRTPFYTISYFYNNKKIHKDFFKEADLVESKIKEALGEKNIRYVLSSLKNNKRASFDIRVNTNYEKTALASKVENKLRKFFPKLKNINQLKVGSLKGGPPVGSDLEVTFLGEDYKELSQVANKFLEKAQSIKGLVSVDHEVNQNLVHWNLQPKNKILSQVGLSLTDVGRSVRLSLEGLGLNEFMIKGRQSEIVLRA